MTIETKMTANNDMEIITAFTDDKATGHKIGCDNPDYLIDKLTAEYAEAEKISRQRQAELNIAKKAVADAINQADKKYFALTDLANEHAVQKLFRFTISRLDNNIKTNLAAIKPPFNKTADRKAHAYAHYNKITRQCIFTSALLKFYSRAFDKVRRPQFLVQNKSRILDILFLLLAFRAHAQGIDKSRLHIFGKIVPISAIGLFPAC